MIRHNNPKIIKKERLFGRRLMISSNAGLAPKWCINPPWPNSAMWRHRSGLTLAQVMACSLVVPSHYLNQCCLIINRVRWVSSEEDTSATNQWNWLENYLSQILLKSCRGQWVNHPRKQHKSLSKEDAENLAKYEGITIGSCMRSYTSFIIHNGYVWCNQCHDYLRQRRFTQEK